MFKKLEKKVRVYKQTGYSIDMLDMSIRTNMALHQRNIHTIGQLKSCDVNSLLKLRPIGITCLTEIIYLVSQLQHKERE